MPENQPSAAAALEDLKPNLRRLADQLAPGAELTDLGTTTHDCRSGGMIFRSWRISFEVPSGTGVEHLDAARRLFAAAGYTQGHEDLDYEIAPDTLWLDRGQPTPSSTPSATAIRPAWT